jgi:hypothetical protein
VAKKRRTLDEVRKLVGEVDALVAGGMSRDEACDKVGLARSVYRRHKKTEDGRSRGSVHVDSLPPRPQRGGKRPPKPLNLMDIQSVANRIGKLDRKIKSVDAAIAERDRLAARLMLLLKPKK